MGENLLKIFVFGKISGDLPHGGREGRKGSAFSDFSYMLLRGGRTKGLRSRPFVNSRCSNEPAVLLRISPFFGSRGFICDETDHSLVGCKPIFSAANGSKTETFS